MHIGDLRKPRRVVTGTTAAGESYLARVEEVDEVDYGYVLPPTPRDFDSTSTAPALGSDSTEGGHRGFFRIWGTDWLPVPLPTDGRSPFFDFQPSPDDTPLALRRASILPPPLGVRIGLGISSGGSPPGRMHWTDSTDILFVMSGKHGQILDEGEVLMHPGDVLVQQGTNHSHQTVEDAVIGYVVVSAMRTTSPPPLELMNPVSGERTPYRGGYRSPELGEKRTMAPWQVAGAASRPYPQGAALPNRIDEMVAPRRVVTATNAAGKSYFARVEHAEEVDHAAAGGACCGQLWRIWQRERLPDLLPIGGEALGEVSAEALRTASLSPAPLGVIVTIARIPPTREPPRMVQRDAMDAVFVMAGDMTLKLDGGVEARLRPGDVVIQNGTRHAWSVDGDTAAVLGIASFGGARFGELPPRSR